MWTRSRWLAATAAVAALAAGAGFLTAHAAGSAKASSFVPITPCRLLDTRPGVDNVGPRSTPLGANETFTATVWGKHGKCNIPTGVTGVSTSVVIVNPSAGSYLTVFPAGATRPLSSNLNWSAGQAPTPNAVTAALSGNGKLSFYNLNGTVDILVDIVGYYELASTGPPGPAGISGYEVVTEEFASSSSAVSTAFGAACPTGKKLLGGGATANLADGGFYSGLRVFSSGPSGDGWVADFDVNNPIQASFVLRVHAICGFVTT